MGTSGTRRTLETCYPHFLLSSISHQVQLYRKAPDLDIVTPPFDGRPLYASLSLLLYDSSTAPFLSCILYNVHHLQQPSTASVLEQILDVTKTSSAMKGAEERELMLGRLIGASALALSGRLSLDPESAAGALKVVAANVGMVLGWG